MGRWLRCPPEPRPASAAQGRPSKRQAPLRVEPERGHWQPPAGTGSFDLRLGRVCRCASHRTRRQTCASRRSLRIAHTTRIVQVFRAPCCTVASDTQGASLRSLSLTPTASVAPSGRRFHLDLALSLRLPHWHTAPAHITGTKRTAWMAAVSRGHSASATSTRNASRHIPLTVAKIQVLALIA